MNILFVCTGNTCRSPMAAALFNKIAVEKNLDVRIESAGICAQNGAPASSGAISAMEKYGIDLSEHRAKCITRELLEECDLILTMTESHKQALLPYAEGRVQTLCEFAEEKGEIPDPYGGNNEIYERCAAKIEAVLLKAAEKIGNNRNEKK